MAETFRDIIGEFDDRTQLAEVWNRKVPVTMKVNVAAVNMWHHRDSVPAWSWAGLVAAAAELSKPDVSMDRLVAADLEARRQRAERRKAS